MRALLVFLPWLVWGCHSDSWGDRTPPRLLATEFSTDGRELALDFDEPVAAVRVAVDGVAAPAPATGPASRVPVKLPEGLKPGSGHVWEAEVGDAAANLAGVAGKFYAPNDHPAQLRLNEVRLAGSGAHSDFVELRVEGDGNLGGWTVEFWSSPTAHQRLILPDAEVVRGDFVVVRYRPNEEAVDTAAGAREYWPADAKGLSATKGLIALRDRPEASVREALVYSKLPGGAGPLAEAVGCSAAELDPSGCTPTRTFSRTEEGEWIITATGGSTPGAANKSTAWTGTPSNRGGPSTPTARTPRRRRESTAPGWRARPSSTTSREKGEPQP